MKAWIGIMLKEGAFMWSTVEHVAKMFHIAGYLQSQGSWTILWEHGLWGGLVQSLLSPFFSTSHGPKFEFWQMTLWTYLAHKFYISVLMILNRFFLFEHYCDFFPQGRSHGCVLLFGDRLVTSWRLTKNCSWNVQSVLGNCRCSFQVHGDSSQNFSMTSENLKDSQTEAEHRHLYLQVVQACTHKTTL